MVVTIFYCNNIKNKYHVSFSLSYITKVLLTMFFNVWPVPCIFLAHKCIREL